MGNIWSVRFVGSARGVILARRFQCILHVCHVGCVNDNPSWGSQPPQRYPFFLCAADISITDLCLSCSTNSLTRRPIATLGGRPTWKRMTIALVWSMDNTCEGGSFGCRVKLYYTIPLPLCLTASTRLSTQLSCQNNSLSLSRARIPKAW